MQKDTPDESNKSEQRLWPSERIAQGGLFHSARVQYNDETSEMLNLMKRESRTTMKLRSERNSPNAETLPKPDAVSLNTLDDPAKNATEIIQRVRNARRSRLQRIIASGAHVRPRERVHRHIEKRPLQANVPILTLTEPAFEPRPGAILVRDDYYSTPQTMIAEIIRQINKRADTLVQMEELGEGAKYYGDIHQEIVQHLRQIKALETKLATQQGGFRFVD